MVRAFVGIVLTLLRRRLPTGVVRFRACEVKRFTNLSGIVQPAFVGDKWKMLTVLFFRAIRPAATGHFWM
jgi:hypothetical protein